MSLLKTILSNGNLDANGVLGRDARLGLLLLLVALIAIGPFVDSSSPATRNLLIRIFIFAMLAISLDFVFGYAGLPSFAHAAMFGAGGYSAAFLLIEYTRNLFVNLLVAFLIGLLIAVVIGWLSVQTHGLYFAFITLALAEMLYIVVFLDAPADLVGASQITQGDNGIVGLPMYEGALVDIGDPLVYYYITLAILVLSVITLVRIANSPFGTVLRGIKENEDRMRAIGYNVTRYKIVAFTLSGGFAALGGAIYAPYQSLVHPQLLHWTVSGELIVMILIGGLGSLWGGMLGAALLLGIEHFLSGIQGWSIVLGAVVIVVILFSPDGLAGVLNRVKRRMIGDRGRSVMDAIANMIPIGRRWR